MATDDEQKNAEDTPETADITEVDVEIVGEEPTASDAPFDDAAVNEKTGAARRSLVSPGVLFFAGMVVIAVAAGAVWYFTTGVYSNAVDDAPPAARAETDASPASDENDDTKLANEAPAKDILQAAPPPAGDDLQPSTPTETIENAELQAGAKEAAASGEDTPSIEDASDAAEPLAFELEEAPAEELPDTQETLPQDEASMDPVDEEIPQADEITEPETMESLDSADPEGAEEASSASEEIDPTEATSSDTDVDGRQRIEAFEAAIGSLQNELAQSNDALSDAGARLEGAQREIALLQAEITALEAENAALKNATRQSPAVAGAVALNAILAAVETGAPFAAELAVVEEAAPAAGALATLRPYADGGAPPMATIRSEFSAAARAGLATANRVNADGVVERYGARVAGLFNLRPASPQPGESPGAVISRAEYAVDQGDLAAAIAEIETLPPPAQDAMRDWIELAQDRAQINGALSALNAAIAEQAAPSESL